MEDMPQYPKDIVKEKEKEEEKEKDKDKEDEEEDEEEKFPTEPNFQQIFFGKWNILPWYFSPYPPLKIDLVKYWEEKEKVRAFCDSIFCPLMLNDDDRK